jgi:hypothetical protein
MLADTAATILGREIGTDAWPAQSRKGWPWDYAFILTDMRCGPKGERVRYLSQVFGFCSPDMKSEDVIAQNAIFFMQVKKVSCPDPQIEINSYMAREATPAAAEAARARAAREPGRRIVPWQASDSTYVRSCR